MEVPQRMQTLIYFLMNLLAGNLFFTTNAPFTFCINSLLNISIKLCTLVRLYLLQHIIEQSYI